MRFRARNEVIKERKNGVFAFFLSEDKKALRSKFKNFCNTFSIKKRVVFRRVIVNKYAQVVFWGGSLKKIIR